MYPISSNYEAPVVRQGKALKYPFPDMRVGDSIPVADKTAAERAYQAARQWGRRNGCRRFAIKDTGDGWRLWRIEDGKPKPSREPASPKLKKYRIPEMAVGDCADLGANVLSAKHTLRVAAKWGRGSNRRFRLDQFNGVWTLSRVK